MIPKTLAILMVLLLTACGGSNSPPSASPGTYNFSCTDGNTGHLVLSADGTASVQFANGATWTCAWSGGGQGGSCTETTATLSCLNGQNSAYVCADHALDLGFACTWSL